MMMMAMIKKNCHPVSDSWLYATDHNVRNPPHATTYGLVCIRALGVDQQHGLESFRRGDGLLRHGIMKKQEALNTQGRCVWLYNDSRQLFASKI